MPLRISTTSTSRASVQIFLIKCCREQTKRRCSMSRLLDWLDRFLRGITVALVLAMLVILTIQIASRYVFGKAFSWSEELALLGFAWVIALSTVLALRHGM